MPAETFDGVAAEERAYKRSLTTDVVEMTDQLLRTIGARDTAVGVGLADARPLYQWRKGRSSPKTPALG